MTKTIKKIKIKSKKKSKKKSTIKHSLKKVSIKEKELSINLLLNDTKYLHLVHITYNKKSYGYFILGNHKLQYYGQRKINNNSKYTDITIDNDKNNYILDDKKCIVIYFHKDKSNNYEYAYLADFFYTRKNELCLTKKNIKPADMFPLFDIVMQELKINTFGLRDASTLHLKYCNYKLGFFGLLEKNYTYYNKFGFIPIMKEKVKKIQTQTTTNPVIEDSNKPLKLTPIGRTTRKILKAATDLKTIKIKEMLHILEHYHYDLSNDYKLDKTKDILFDNLSENLKYRIKEIISIYNKENSKASEAGNLKKKSPVKSQKG
jgi:hypothetical protein